MTTNRARPRISCTPCLVRYEGVTYHVRSNGAVYEWVDKKDDGEPLSEHLAKAIRREASRLRRNRNARERNQARRDVGMRYTAHGWE